MYKEILSKVISFFLGKSVVTSYNCSYEVSWDTGWHSEDIVKLYLNGKGTEHFFGQIINVKKTEFSNFTYTIEYWPKKALLKKYFDLCEIMVQRIKYYLLD